MPTTIRFHLDENVDHAVAHGLRLRGIDVTTASDVELISASDETHLAFALKEQRIIVTHDPDFLQLHADGVTHGGIVFCHKDSRSIGETIRDCLTPEEMRQNVQFI